MLFQYRKKSYVLTHFYERMDWLGKGKLALCIDHFSAKGWTETCWKLAVFRHHPHELLAVLGAGSFASDLRLGVRSVNWQLHTKTQDCYLEFNIAINNNPRKVPVQFTEKL